MEFQQLAICSLRSNWRLDDDDKGRALLLAGRSATELNDLKAARRYFQQALTLADSAANARSWLEYINALEEYPQS